ncbi:MAG: hypothetical protein LAT68_13085 [Cyclobacteriaceae bacterium]|nr:hypothetical protein [Cyclobacteriaceae bacterium]MCH8517255.1 hypothetical protein [Cyclobacteriaceae bacterium]
MDKHRIFFECIETPRNLPELKGFTKGKVYEGRSFNGLYEVSLEWGNGKPNSLISKKLFKSFFKERNEELSDLKQSS